MLASDMYPGAAPHNFLSVPVWLDQESPDYGRRPDFVTRSLAFAEGGDQDYWAIGCSVLFLNWLRFQLGFTWEQIITSGATTLDGVYWNLTGRTDALSLFMKHVDDNFPPNTTSHLNTDQPFPLPGLPTEQPFKIITGQSTLPAPIGPFHKEEQLVNSFTGQQFAEALSSSRGLVLPLVPLTVTGMAKLASSAPGAPLAFAFSPGTNCRVWLTIPAAMVEKVDYLDKVACNDHQHDFIRIHFANPTTDEGKAFIELLRQVLGVETIRV